MRLCFPRFCPAWLLGWLLLLAPVGRLAAMPFTYQGRLVDGTALANGNYELRFRLFDQLTAGSQISSDVSLAAVAVTNGLFTVQLDFGAGAFNGASRWLELAARPSGSVDPLAVFDPRQPVTAVPYALYALGGAGDASALTTGTLPDARLASTIARTTQLVTLSNSLSARLDQLSAALLGVSNQFQAVLPPGITVASTDPADSALTAQGLVKILTFEAPGWKNGAASGAPSARIAHSAVWTGQSLLVWGGTVGGGGASASGNAYDPVLDQWTLLSTINAPAARSGHTAVWTGNQMLVWGGFGSTYLGTGAAYAPANLGWTALTTTGAPAERDGHVAVWTGARMLVWGGRNAGGLLADGATLDPVGNAWTALPTASAPEARKNATAVWAGDRVIIFGGEGEGGMLGSGAMLTFTGGATAGSWQALASLNAPTPRSGHSAVWTGTKLIVWGGTGGGAPLGDGAEFDPILNQWTALPSDGAPAGRTGHLAVWTGSEMLVFGGDGGSGSLASGAAYSPATGHWRPLSGTGSPLARSEGTGVWTGAELLVFGGKASGAPLAALQRLNPQPTWNLYRKP
ncbi:MAG TPA: kelch repeat-containing protein [Candidatus Limnocylindria bacterium]|nr:kelch repeat-containing protein [Candidatus Limnocylindria bacterium]